MLKVYKLATEEAEAKARGVKKKETKVLEAEHKA